MEETQEVDEVKSDRFERRIREKVKKIEELEDLIDSLKSENERIKSEIEKGNPELDSLRNENAALKKEFSDYKSKVSESEEFVKVGLVDEEAREIARHFWSKLPEKERPALSELIEGWKLEPESMPKAMRGYIIDETEVKSKKETSKKKDAPVNPRQGSKTPQSKDPSTWSIKQIEEYMKENY